MEKALQVFQCTEKSCPYFFFSTVFYGNFFFFFLVSNCQISSSKHKNSPEEFCKKGVLRNSQNSQENTFARVSFFNKVVSNATLMLCSSNLIAYQTGA